jgi:hypothetical protein
MQSSMAQIKSTPPALLLAAIFSSQRPAIQWAIRQISDHWGVIGLVSPQFEHSETGYYSQQMGRPLLKQFFVVDQLWDPAKLADCKVQSNRWEQQLVEMKTYIQPRPVNIDPGYLMLGKLVLASTKDRAHRIYLRDGIYAEECLYYVAGWQSRPWTYPDYQRADYQQFFDQVRERLKQLIHEQSGSVHS